MKKYSITLRDTLSQKGYNHLYIPKEFHEILSQLGVMIIPIYDSNMIEEAIEITDGLIVIGSNTDINPERYGQKAIEDVHPLADDTDYFDLNIIKKFHSKNKPILGICRGMQIINVCFGGSLYQDISGHKIPRTERHSINIIQDSFLYNTYEKESIEVTSTHHQAIKDVANGFKITATSDDDIIEGIENGNIIGVQFHPEYANDLNFFKHFISI